MYVTQTPRLAEPFATGDIVKAKVSDRPPRQAEWGYLARPRQRRDATDAGTVDRLDAGDVVGEKLAGAQAADSA